MRYERDPSIVALHGGLFRQDPNYRVARPGGSVSWLLLATLAGAGQVGTIRLAKGEVALIAPQTPQSYRTAEGEPFWELAWVHFHARPSWGPLLAMPEREPGVAHVTLDKEANAFFAALETSRAHGESTGDPFEEWLAMAALETALVRLRRAADEREPKGDLRVRRAAAYVLRHLAQPIGPDSIARAVGLSPSRLGALFRAEVGVSPRAFIERQRMERARSLLAMTDLPVKAIAAQVGFESEFYFANRFRQAVGMSPTAFRTGSRAKGQANFSCESHIPSPAAMSPSATLPKA